MKYLTKVQPPPIQELTIVDAYQYLGDTSVLPDCIYARQITEGKLQYTIIKVLTGMWRKLDPGQWVVVRDQSEIWFNVDIYNDADFQELFERKECYDGPKQPQSQTPSNVPRQTSHAQRQHDVTER